MGQIVAIPPYHISLRQDPKCNWHSAFLLSTCRTLQIPMHCRMLLCDWLLHRAAGIVGVPRRELQVWSVELMFWSKSRALGLRGRFLFPKMLLGPLCKVLSVGLCACDQNFILNLSVVIAIRHKDFWALFFLANYCCFACVINEENDITLEIFPKLLWQKSTKTTHSVKILIANIYANVLTSASQYGNMNRRFV